MESIKIIRILSIVAVCLFLTAFAFGKEPKWYLKAKQIRIYESTRQDVENVFNSFKIKSVRTFERTVEVEYKHKGDELSVIYSTGRCSNPPKVPIKDKFFYDGDDVDKDVVVFFLYRPKKKVDFRKFNFDLSDYKKFHAGDVDYDVYESSKLGIVFYVGKGKLYNVGFSTPDSKRYLVCKPATGSNVEKMSN
jgi:hypothetical protein